MSTLVAYIAIFIGAGIFGIANGAPLNPLQILWLNMVVDIPIAIALGFDEPDRGPDGAPAAPGRRAGAVPQQLDPAVRPGRRDDGRVAGRLPDRRRPGRRRRRRHDAAHHAVAVPRGRGAAVPRPARTRSSTGTPSRRHAAAALRRSRCWRSSSITALDFLAAHLRHRGAELRPVVHLHRHRRVASSSSRS